MDGKNDKAQKSEFVSPVRIRRILLLILCFIIGMIAGARYVCETRTAKVWLGSILPPHPENFTKKEYDTIRMGMEKGAVIDVLNLEMCRILCGSRLEDLKKAASGSRNTDWRSPDVLPHIVEIWMIPRRKTGITDYLLLGFDNSHRVCYKGIEEFMMGQNIRLSD